MLALEAVGALTDDEHAELATALQRRPDLQAELEELRAVALTLADATIEPPPPTLRASVLDAINATPQHPAVAPVVSLDSRRRVPRWLAVGAAAAATVAVVAGALFIATSDEAGPGDQVAAVLEDDAAQRIAMQGQLTGLTLVYSEGEDAAVLTGEGLPLPAADRVYELWAVRGEATPERVDVFRPDRQGDVELLLTDIDPASAVWAITEEPAGGSDAPTTPIIAQTA